MSIISDLTKWLKKTENSPAKLAYLLGYETSQAVEAWLRRKSIPKLQEKRIKEIIYYDVKGKNR